MVGWKIAINSAYFLYCFSGNRGVNMDLQPQPDIRTDLPRSSRQGESDFLKIDLVTVGNIRELVEVLTSSTVVSSVVMWVCSPSELKSARSRVRPQRRRRRKRE